MHARSLTQAQLGAELGRDQAFVSRVISGKNDPRMSTVKRLLDRVGLEVHITYKSKDDDPVKRRAFLAGVTSVTFVPSAKADPRKDPQYVRQLSERLRLGTGDQGGTAYASTAMRNLNNVWAAITKDNGDFTGGHRELKAAASGLACQTAWTVFSAGSYAAAGNIAGSALKLAHQLNDADAQSRAYTALSEVSLNQGMAERGISYARRSVCLPGVIPEQHLLSTVRLVRSLALVPGQEKSVWPILDQVQSADSLSRDSSVSVIGNSGIVLSDLGRYEEASQLLGEAVRLSERWPYRQANWVMRQVENALRAEDPSMAADRMRALAYLMPLAASGRLENHVSQILAESAHWRGVAEVREAREQLQSMMPMPPKTTRSKR